MNIFYAAAIQMVSGKNIEPNLAEADKLIARAAGRGAKLVVLPECFALFGEKDQTATGIAEATDQGGIRQKLSAMAKKYNVYLVSGTIPVSDAMEERRPFAACFLYDNQGQEIARYNKIHLFDVDVDDAQGCYKESDTYQPGNTVVFVDTPLGRIGLAVCYDLRFPELFRLLFQEKVDLLVIPAAFTKVTGAAHWLPLLQARAIENQCFVIGANQGGKHSEARETYGHSAIVSPWGEVTGLIKRGEGIAMSEIDREFLADVRKKMPIAGHQRFFVHRPE